MKAHLAFISELHAVAVVTRRNDIGVADMIRNSRKAFISDNCSVNIRLMQKFQNELKKLPEGSLCKKKIRGKDRYYHYLPSGVSGVRGKEIYINKNNEMLIRQLARRKFIEDSLQVLEKIIKSDKQRLKSPLAYDPTEVATSLPEAYKDIDYSPILDSTESNHPLAWRNEPYKKNTLHPEKLVYKTQNGLQVRSKSESIIAGLLESENIPFRYEALLVLNGKNYYPDFTILNPQDNQIVYWEHFGMVDDKDYAMAMERKLEVYKRHGIHPWNNLIITYESETNPLNTQRIGRIIKVFLRAE